MPKTHRSYLLKFEPNIRSHVASITTHNQKDRSTAASSITGCQKDDHVEGKIDSIPLRGRLCRHISISPGRACHHRRRGPIHRISNMNKKDESKTLEKVKPKFSLNYYGRKKNKWRTTLENNKKATAGIQGYGKKN